MGVEKEFREALGRLNSPDSNSSPLGQADQLKYVTSVQVVP